MRLTEKKIISAKDMLISMLTQSGGLFPTEERAIRIAVEVIKQYLDMRDFCEEQT